MVKDKLHSVMARLDRLYLEDGDDAFRDESEEERRAKLFRWGSGNRFQLAHVLTPSQHSQTDQG